MDRQGEESAAILAVIVRPAGGAARLAQPASGLLEQRIAFVRAFLATAGGTVIESAGSDACLHFNAWRHGLDAAIALTREISQLTTHLAGMRVGVGLDLTDAPDDANVAERAATLAGSARANEIRLGEALAAVARDHPPDRRMVMRVDGDEGQDGEVFHRLAIARDEVATNLPAPLTSFVGREAELAKVGGLLAETRLVTVTGPPGAGKTRLATELAERVLGRFEGGSWFVGLAPIGDQSLVLPTLSEALGSRAATDRPLIDAISTQLGTRRVLVFFDNFEHVTGAATDLVALLAAVPSLTVLVTSRRLLRVSGEHEFALPPLRLPRLSGSADDAALSEAVVLFVQRAETADPTFRLRAADVSLVGELCRRLDGMPLAIELAAARVRLLPLAAILDRLDHRLVLLAGGPRDVPTRHQSLRAAVAWSYDLLEPTAQSLFRRLSVFRGGWIVEGAVAVSGGLAADSGAVVEGVASLLDASLLARQARDAAEQRFTMLETLREFAAERLVETGEADETRARHAAYCLALVERYEPDFTGNDRATALDRVSVEHDDIRSALDYLIGANPGDALRLGARMWRFWQMRGHLLEGARWLNSALEAAGDLASEDLRSQALAAAGGIAYWRGDMAEAQQLYERALALRRRLGGDVGIADALYDLAFALGPFNRPPPVDPDRTEEAAGLAEEAEALYRKAGNELGVARSGWQFGTLMLWRDMDRARQLLGVSVERFRRLNDPFGLGWALRTYGDALLGSAELAAAADAFGEALRLVAAAEDGSAMGMLLDDFADVAMAEGDGLRAARLRGAAASMRDATEAGVANASDAPWVIKKSAPEGPTDPAALDRAWAEGRAMSQAEATAYALRDGSVPVPDRSLRVTALGSFLVERAGARVSHWGGPKAGSRQAQAMFAFLLDRGDRGVTKDEFIEVIWPDAGVSQGDLNFHRTLAGLRSTLEPGTLSRSGSSVPFANGRYRLGTSVVGWLDVAEFEQRLLNAAQATDDQAAIRGLEAARALYHGDYLDDCPLYGDSEFVEERRGFLRGRLTDSLVELGRRYEARGDRLLAAERFREALAVSGGDSPKATAALKRLGVASAEL